MFGLAYVVSKYTGGKMTKKDDTKEKVLANKSYRLTSKREYDGKINKPEKPMYKGL